MHKKRSSIWIKVNKSMWYCIFIHIYAIFMHKRVFFLFTFIHFYSVLMWIKVNKNFIFIHILCTYMHFLFTAKKWIKVNKVNKKSGAQVCDVITPPTARLSARWTRSTWVTDLFRRRSQFYHSSPGWSPSWLLTRKTNYPPMFAPDLLINTRRLS